LLGLKTEEDVFKKLLEELNLDVYKTQAIYESEFQVLNRIQEKGYRNRPLTKTQERNNKAK
jgi:hypothetical protein